MRESMDFDVVIVGAGPAGLSAAIRLAQLGEKHNKPLSICVIEKGAEVGAHLLSGAVLDPQSLNELIPDWQEKNAPVTTAVIEDQFNFFTKTKSIRLPTPPQMHNHGNFIISLGEFGRWLATQAEMLGVNIFPEFAAVDYILENEKVVGIITGDKGVDKHGNKTPVYQEGIELRAKYTFLAEGCRGSLSERIMQKFDLRANCDPQTYGLGIKELWEIDPSQHKAGLVQHSIGWPLDNKTYGGSFVYHFKSNLLAIGFVVGLDYQNPYLNPYEEFQRFKTHPTIRPLLENAKRIGYGGRSLNEGGFQSIPKLAFPGGVLIGCAAGFLNVPKIKGIHNAMRSGMIAAESVFQEIDQPHSECNAYEINMQKSATWKELKSVRNIRPAMTWGLLPGLAYSALDTYVLRGKAPWTFKNHADHLQLKKARDVKPIEYPKHDNQITFDLMTSVFLTNSMHDENQPCHLKLKNPEVAISVNFKEYASPEQRYCPAGVYEIIEVTSPQLQINAANCIHCKACDIKDITQNIVWIPPEGGSGPRYNSM